MARIAKGVNESTSESDAKLILKKITAKHAEIAEVTELQLKTAAGGGAWTEVLKTQAGLLGPLIVFDKDIVELFDLTDDQQKQLRDLIPKSNPDSITDGAKAASVTESKRNEVASLSAIVSQALDAKQKRILEECTTLANALIAFEEERMNSTRWTFGGQSQVPDEVHSNQK